MSKINLAEVREQWVKEYVDANQFDGGMEKVQVNLTAEEIDTLIYCMDLRCLHTPEMVRLARLLNKAQMSLGHESLKQTYDVVKGVPSED